MNGDFSAAEVELLSIYWQQPEKLDLDDSPFFSKEAKAIYEALVELYTKDASLSIRNILREAKRRYSKTSLDSIEDIDAMKADPKDFEYLKSRVEQEDVKITLSEEVLEEMYGLLQSRSELDIDRFSKSLAKAQSEIERYQGKTDRKLLSASDMVGRLQEELNLRAQGKGVFPTGDKWIDGFLTYGFAPGSQTTVFSASGLGKTAVKMKLLNARINLGLPTLSVELEMEDVALAERLVAMRKRIPYRFFHPHHLGEIPPNVIRAVEEQKKSLIKAKNFEYYNDAGLSIEGLKSLIRDSKKRMGVDYLAVFVDLTTMLSDFKEGSKNSAETYQYAVDKLHELTRSDNVHIINFVQANRDIVASKLKKPEDVYGITPQPKHVKHSSAFEERSRALIGLNRPKFYLEQMFPDSPENEIEENIMELWFLKQNGGPLGKLKYLFQPETFTLTKYFDYEDEE